LHEFSIAAEIWGSVARAAREHGSARVKAIKLEIGALNLIEEEQIRFWLEVLAEKDGSAGVEVRVTTTEGREIKVVSAEVVLPDPRSADQAGEGRE
jgi:Zn finger protein HypA/HybF involved in hydrogenase expression